MTDAEKALTEIPVKLYYDDTRFESSNLKNAENFDSTFWKAGEEKWVKLY